MWSLRCIRRIELCATVKSHRIDSSENSVQSWLVYLPSLDHLIRPVQHGLRNRQTDLLCRLEINHQLKLRGLLHRKIGGFGSLQDSVHVICDAPVAVRKVGPVVYESSGI
jgi:hypothetical protein